MNGEDLYRLVSCTFLHGSVTHLFGNIYSLGRLGPEVERYFGTGRFACVYLISGISGSLASAMFTPNPSLGASGAVFGLVGAYATFVKRNIGVLNAYNMKGNGGALQSLCLSMVLGLTNPMTDNWAHVGGFLGGAFAANVYGPRLSMRSLPNGSVVVIDKPISRLPRCIEKIPEQISKTFSIPKQISTTFSMIPRW
eukprot:CAMPEP_0194138300 /NCGR_PEP_ID=MMETSP0152-20130528/8134_1 /TAXON_ID=1049557 /ORGANISM="Thalassiothrix antarctica, Strain L6-D1" /LENGTH=195 /DNA_ID=CAMNT_0038835727 /DNA_START=97 /DNA_END=681 /DNA_ORIENTATION=-